MHDFGPPASLQTTAASVPEPSRLSPPTPEAAASLPSTANHESALPAAVPLARIYPAARRAKYTGVMLGLVVSIPFAVLGSMKIFGPTHGELGAIGACMLSAFTSGIASGVAALLHRRGHNRRLMRELTERFAGRFPVHDAVFVGLAVGDELCHYGGSVDWDIGLLALEGDRLRYLGDRCGFELAREQVTGLSLVMFPSMRPPLLRGVRVEWRDSLTGRQGVLILRFRRFRTLFDCGRCQRALGKRIQAWLAAGVAKREPAMEWPLPPQRVEGGVPPTPPPLGQILQALRTRHEADGWLLPIPAEAPALDRNQLPIPRDGASTVGADELPRV